MNESLKIPSPRARTFLPDDLEVGSWDALQPYFDDLLAEPVESVAQLKAWMEKVSELEIFLYEKRAWRFIQMTRNTADETAQEEYKSFVSDINPHLYKYSDLLRRKLYHSPSFSKLDTDVYQIVIRAAKNEVELFRKENIKLLTQAQEKAQEYDQLASSLVVEIDGETLTLQKAGTFLEDPRREFREEVWKKITSARLNSADSFDKLMGELIEIRHEIAENAGMDSFADYKMLSMGRFDYGREECFRFHDSISKVVGPAYEKLIEKRKNLLGFDELKPWDSIISPTGDDPLRPFSTTKELVEKASRVFGRLNPAWEDKLLIMDKMGHLDLENRVNKAPGGYNYTLPESNAPFIFMNTVGTQNDLVTMMHEGGHALHSFASEHITLSDFRNIPSEIAELAAMSMELITMEHWGEFYTDPEELKRAQIDQLQRPISILPWISAIDKFQFWIYDNKDASPEERNAAWQEIYLTGHGKPYDWSGHENVAKTAWHKQRHVFDLPFYYIEYGIAQLGAIAIWRNYKQNPEKALADFWAGLSLGYTRPIPEVYAAAGIRFDFSEAYIAELIQFLEGELAALEA